MYYKIWKYISVDDDIRKPIIWISIKFIVTEINISMI